MRLYLDSSALAKRYLQESGSETVAQQCAQASEIILSILASPEILSALNRLRREKKISPQQYLSLKQDCAKDLAEVTIVNITLELVRLTIGCLETCQVKTLDAIHLASAKSAHAELFLTADRQQMTAAKKFGLAALLVSPSNP